MLAFAPFHGFIWGMSANDPGADSGDRPVAHMISARRLRVAWVLAAIIGAFFSVFPASANDCAAAVNAGNALNDERDALTFPPSGSDNATRCRYSRRYLQLTELIAAAIGRAEQICGNALQVVCGSGCQQREVETYRRYAQMDCAHVDQAPPGASPPSGNRVGVCQCFSLQQLPRAGSQFPFRAVNNCSVAVSFTYLDCEQAGRGVQCKEVSGYASRNSSDEVTGYNYSQEARLVRACGPGGQCCTP